MNQSKNPGHRQPPEILDLGANCVSMTGQTKTEIQTSINFGDFGTTSDSDPNVLQCQSQTPPCALEEESGRAETSWAGSGMQYL